MSPLKGGDPFCISFTPCLGVHVSTSVHAVFVKLEVILGNVRLCVTPECLFGRSIPGAPSSGWANVIIKNHNGSSLGSTKIFYLPDEEEIGFMVHDFSLFEIFSEEMTCNTANSFGGSDEDPQRCGVFGNAQQVQFLRLLVYTAAREGAQQFIEMIFSTSAGRLVFNAYKDGRPLPELVARDHGHNNTACYLEDVAKRFSEEISASKEYPKTIDWSELTQAASKEGQRKYAKFEGEEDFRGMPSHDDGSSSDYLADADTSSCESVEGDSERSDSEGIVSGEIEPTEKKAPSLTPPDELSSQEKTQFDQMEDEKRISFWSSYFRMSARILASIGIELRGHKLLFRTLALSIFVVEALERITLQGVKVLLVYSFCILTLMRFILPEGWELVIVLIVFAWIVAITWIVVIACLVVVFFLSRPISSDISEGKFKKFKNSAATVPSNLHESDYLDEAECAIYDPRPPMLSERRCHPSLGALDASRKSNPKVFESGHEVPFLNYLVKTTLQEKKIKSLTETYRTSISGLILLVCIVCTLIMVTFMLEGRKLLIVAIPANFFLWSFVNAYLFPSVKSSAETVPTIFHDERFRRVSFENVHNRRWEKKMPVKCTEDWN